MNRFFFFITILTLFSIFNYSLSFGATTSRMTGLFKKILPNGLTAVVKESHRAPVVAVQIWVKAGSAYETDKQAGITHLIEHMIFKGTEKRGPGELAAIIESLGGTINAYTSYDYTVYHCVVPSSHLSTALDVLEDAVFHSKFDPDELEREKKVVLEEMKMRMDNPHTRMFENLMRISYKVYPYRRPIIGFEETVRSFTRQDILSYMAEHYRPCNMTVIVTGDVDGEQALSQIEHFFGKEQERPCKEAAFPKEPTQQGPRIIETSMDCNEGYLAISFSGLPSFTGKDTPALDLLSSLLSDGESSILVSKLKNQLQIVHSIQASAFTPKGPGLFEITADIDPQNLERVLLNVLKEISRLKEQEVSPKDLKKAKTQIVTDFLYSQETMEGEARKLGVFQTLAGDASKEIEYIESVKAVTAKDIMDVAKKYLDPQRINVSLVSPESASVSFDDKALAKVIKQASNPELEEASGATMIIGKGKVKRFTVGNDVTLLCLEAHDLPTVGIRIVLPGGLRYENQSTNGIFNLLAQAWTKGTTLHNSKTLSELIDSMGADIHGFSGQNSFGLKARFTSDTFRRGLGLLAEILLSPSFPEDEIEKLKPQILASIRQQDDYMPSVAVREFKKLLFSPHPYSMNVLGTPENVMRFSRDDILNAYHNFVVPDRAIIAVVGDFDADQLKQELTDLLKDWQNQAEGFLPTPPSPAPLNSPKVVNIHRDKQQEHIVLGFMGTSISDQDRYPLEVLNAILAGQGGRLFKELRDKESLAYSVTSFLNFGVDCGFVAAYIACSPEKKKKAQKGLWRELYKIQEEPPEVTEVQRAINWLLGRYQISLQTPGAKAMDMAINELLGLGYDFSNRYPALLRQVTPQQVMDVAKKYLGSQAYVLVSVGP